MERRHDILRGYRNVATRTQKKKNNNNIIIMNTSKETNKQTNETIVLVVYLGGMYKIYIPDSGQQCSHT